MFVCDKCGREFKYKHVYQKHAKRITPCIKEIPEAVPDTMCEWCGNSFSDKYGLSKHKKRCAVKKNQEKIRKIKEEKESDAKVDKLVEALATVSEENKQLQMMQQKLLDEMRELKNEKVNINYQSKYVQNNVVIINNAIDPNVDYIDEKMVEEYLDKYKLNAPVFLTKEIYYGDRAENHSLHIANQKTKSGFAYRNHTWVPVERESIKLYLLNGLDISYNKIMQHGRKSKKYANDSILDEIARNQYNKVARERDMQNLMYLASQASKNTDVNYNFIEEDIKRGKASYRMIEEILDDDESGAASNNRGNNRLKIIQSAEKYGRGAGGGKEEAD